MAMMVHWVTLWSGMKWVMTIWWSANIATAASFLRAEKLTAPRYKSSLKYKFSFIRSLRLIA
jgi:hypothetical protein